MATQDYWAFLLQQEGDRNWLPLDASDVTVKAGRYRIIARSNRRNVDVEIRIAHTSSLSPTAKCNTRNRSAKTNEKGFLLVLPFNTMQPGLWEFRCAGNALSEVMGESWQHSVKLQVQPQATPETPHTTPTPATNSVSGPAPTKPEAIDIPESKPTPASAIAPTPNTPVRDEAVEPIVAELAELFEPTPSNDRDQPSIPELSTDAAPPSVDAVSLEELFGDAAATSMGLSNSDELANELASIGQPTAEAEAEIDFDDLWATAGPNDDLASSLTQLEVVSDNDETLLDWDAANALANSSEATQTDTAANPHDELTSDESTSRDSASKDLQGDDLSVFDELFSTIDAPSTELTDVNQLLDEADQPLQLNDDDDGANESDDVLTFTDADALAVESETANPNLDFDPEIGDVTIDETTDPSEPTTDLAITETTATPPHPVSENTPAPSIWGIGTRTGATAAMTNSVAASQPSTVTTTDITAVNPHLTDNDTTKTSPTVDEPSVSKPTNADNQDPITSDATVPHPTTDSSESDASDTPIAPETMAPANITASPAEVSALIDNSDIVADRSITPPEHLETTTAVEADDDVVAPPDVTPPTDSDTLMAEALTNVVSQALPPLTIALEPSMYNFQSGAVLMIYGQVVPADAASETLQAAVIAQGEVVVKLIDPQTATQVAEYRQPLERQSLPITIAAPLHIPDTVNAQLLVGEVAVWDDGIEELTQQNFTAMAAVDDLMATIESQQATAQVDNQTERKGDPPLPPVDFGFFNYIGDAPADAPEPAPLTKRESMQDVELPGSEPAVEDTAAEVDDSIFATDDIELANPLDTIAADTPVAADADTKESVADSEVEATAIAAENSSGITSTSGKPLPDDWFDLSIEEEAAPQATSDSADNADATATDATPPAPNSDAIAPEAMASEATDSLPEPAIPISNSDPAANEVVVDDLPEALPTPIANTPEIHNPLLIPAADAVPEPTIEILEDGELITGQAVHVRVKVPSILPKLYVKLWINDRQSRTLLDGPRWMVDFVPNGHNELEAMTQLTVPFGSLEIQIAAITVEATTKRESYRTAIDREVIPPNLDDENAELSFDEL
ncbi:hypothetical protein IQ266_21065 [filamentous cyanobacterium LEGE 11480]|uniref:Uncharacterized protein n=1 Tax=Romeriopsis navalis LEGE 11480 TaxID=2777977 RepID=A0A928VPR4_9CYAN|nr:hypothetical protein [Romeriopsis navalis]MBE9032235.1 hypothetical protein [Romeriopsis navalis LEGE 11480]